MKSVTPPTKTHPNLVLTALLSSSMTVIVSVIYFVLSIVAIVYRYECDLDLTKINGANFFITQIYVLYIQANECFEDITWVDELMHADTVFLLLIFTLIFSFLALLTACFVIVVMANDKKEYMNLVVYVYIGIWTAVFVIDLTFAIHFGMDYGWMNYELKQMPPAMHLYADDLLRLGAFFFMTIALKGFVVHAMNIVLIILMVVYLVENQKEVKKNEHSIHKIGALNAYDQPRRQEDPWQSQPEMFLHLPRNQHTNSAFEDDISPLPPAPRSPMREQTMPDYSNNRYYDRSESWQRRSPSGSRPFSYLEEPPRRPMPVKTPPVPAPDYSPPARRLKSALKPGYM